MSILDNTRRHALVCFSISCLALGAGAAQAQAQAQDFPNRPITIVVPFSAGGGPDRIVRIVAQKMHESLKQPVVIDYKPGATGLIGASFVQKAKPDGYTLLFNGNSTMVVAPMLRNPPPFDVLRDFAPVTIVLRYPMMLIVPANHPAKTVQEFVALAKPGNANFASPGVGSVGHLASEVFARRAGVSMTHVPYKGLGEAQTAVIAGDVQLYLDGPLSSAELIRAGKVKALAVTGDKRVEAFPKVPSLAEEGYPEVDSLVWVGIFAPKGTPEDIVRKLSSEMTRIIRSDEVREVISQGGLAEAMGGTPQDMTQVIKAETPVFLRLVKELDLKNERLTPTQTDLRTLGRRGVAVLLEAHARHREKSRSLKKHHSGMKRCCPTPPLNEKPRLRYTRRRPARAGGLAEAGIEEPASPTRFRTIFHSSGLVHGSRAIARRGLAPQFSPRRK